MTRKFFLATLLFAAALVAAGSAQARHRARLDANGNLDALIARHAAANSLPESLVRRVITRESRGNARVVSRGNYGLMQIKLATARSMGYRGDAAGLLDADTNMTYAVKYLAGAYRVAGGNADRAVHYYAAGYYYAAKRRGLTDTRANRAFAAMDISRAGPVSLATKIVKARQSNESVSSGSNPYSGKLDYY
jgi:soluble lytic murein transglycosylase-like protein